MIKQLRYDCIDDIRILFYDMLYILYTETAGLLCIVMQQVYLTLGYIRHDPFASWRPPMHPKPLPYDVDWFWLPFFAIKVFDSGDIVLPPKSIFSSLC